MIYFVAPTTTRCFTRVTIVQALTVCVTYSSTMMTTEMMISSLAWATETDTFVAAAAATVA